MALHEFAARIARQGIIAKPDVSRDLVRCDLSGAVEVFGTAKNPVLGAIDDEHEAVFVRLSLDRSNRSIVLSRAVSAKNLAAEIEDGNAAAPGLFSELVTHGLDVDVPNLVGDALAVEMGPRLGAVAALGRRIQDHIASSEVIHSTPLGGRVA